MAVRGDVLRAAGGLGAVAHHTVEDVALVRAMATAGFAVATLDASDLLTVRMYETAPDAWRGWGRSLPLPGVDSRVQRLVALGTLALVQVAPLARVVARRADVLDVVLLALRAGTLVGTARAYTRRGLPYWLSPMADVVAVAALVRSTIGRPRAWRGRGRAVRSCVRPSRSAGRRST
jgi:dolichol-phosphate mannosyltransferase